MAGVDGEFAEFVEGPAEAMAKLPLAEHVGGQIVLLGEALPQGLINDDEFAEVAVAFGEGGDGGEEVELHEWQSFQCREKIHDCFSVAMGILFGGSWLWGQA